MLHVCLHEALTPGCVPLQRHPSRLRGATVLGKGPVVHTCFFFLYIRRVGAQLQNLSLPSDLVGGALRDSESTLVTVSLEQPHLARLLVLRSSVRGLGSYFCSYNRHNATWDAVIKRTNEKSQPDASAPYWLPALNARTQIPSQHLGQDEDLAHLVCNKTAPAELRKIKAQIRDQAADQESQNQVEDFIPLKEPAAAGFQMSLLPSGPVASFLGVMEERQGRVPRPQPLWIFPPTVDSLYRLSPTKAQAELAALSRPNPWNHRTYLNSAQRKRGLVGGTGSLPSLAWCRLSCVPSLVPSCPHIPHFQFNEVSISHFLRS